MRPILLALAALVVLPVQPAAAQRSAARVQPRADRVTPGYVRVRIDTSDGAIVLALDTRRAPATTANFLGYVDDGRFDDTAFYRAARSRANPRTGFIQGGIRTDARRILPPFPLERTDQTGIRHLDGTISMARRADPASAGGNFSIMVGPAPHMDAKGAFPGYAAFGHVVAGMATVRRILAEPTGGGSEAMAGQMLIRQVRLIRARRLDGTPRPTGRPKAWLIEAKPQPRPPAVAPRR